MGFQGYPEISILYFGKTENVADGVAVTFVVEEGAEPMEERFQSGSDAREDETIQSAIVKMIERAEARTVKQATSIELIK